MISVRGDTPGISGGAMMGELGGSWGWRQGDAWRWVNKGLILCPERGTRRRHNYNNNRRFFFSNCVGGSGVLLRVVN